MKSDLLKNPIIFILLVALISLIVYSNTFQVPFHLDDKQYIIENLRIKTLSNIPSLYTDIKGEIGPRPVTLTTFAINFYLGGLDTTGYHIFNILVHIINGVLLYFLIIMTGRLLKCREEDIRLTGFFASLVFVSHPIQTECVTYIVGRSTPLITVFYLSGIMLFVKAVRSEKGSGKYIAGLFFVSLLGMGSRENFVTFPFMLILYDFYFISAYKMKNVARHYKAHIPVLLSLVYFAYLVMNYEYDDIRVGSKIATPFEYLMTQFNVHWTYMRLLLLPIGQNLDYSYPISRTLFEVRTMVSLTGYIGLLAGGVYLYKRKPVISFGILWFIITLSPVSSVIPLANMIFEHRLYLPSIGIVIVMTMSMYYILRLTEKNLHRSVVIYSLLFTAIITIFSGTTYSRNRVWADEVTLWKDVVHKSPRNPRAYSILGLAYQSKGFIDQAIEQYRIAIGLNYSYVDAQYNLGLAYQSKGFIDKAIEQYRTVIQLDSDYVEAYNNLGNVYQSIGLIDKAIEHYRRALSLKPDYPTHYNLGTAYHNKGLTESAIAQYEAAIKTNPDFKEAHLGLGRIYFERTEIEKALKEFEIVLGMDASHHEARSFLERIDKMKDRKSNVVN